MNARECLMQSLNIRVRMRYLQERIDKLESELGYHPKQLDNTGASHLNYREDKFAEKMAEIADIKTEYLEELEALERKNESLQSLIKVLRNPDFREVLTERYIKENKKYYYRLNPWENIAIEMNLGKNGVNAVKQKHKRALKALDNFIKTTLTDTL